MSESAIRFDCEGTPLVGILHRPPVASRRGVLIVVGGGPQYRVGGHRQLVLWARRLAEEGTAVLRFDYRGMGDSYGEFRGFGDIDQDIRSALDRFCVEIPELSELVLWGECDAATAIVTYAYRDPRVKGIVLLNPYARTEAGQARTLLRHYYLSRLMEPSFWRKVVSLRFNPLASLGSALGLLQRARGAKPVVVSGPDTGLAAPLPRELSLPERLLGGFSRFRGTTLLVMSGRDLYAREFDETVGRTAAWQQQFTARQGTRRDLAEADHTFSSAEWRNQVAAWATDWLRSW